MRRPRAAGLDRARLGRLGLAASVMFIATMLRAAQRRVGRTEKRTFSLVNGLPDSAHRPIAVVMQFGSLGSVGATSGLAWVTNRRSTAAALATSGLSMWLFCKGIKRFIGRGRPADHLYGVTIRGRAQAGLGFPSGHSAVAASLAVVVAADARSPQAVALGTAASLVALGRMYVGAHLPLDVLGGAAVGTAAGAAARAVFGLPVSPSTRSVLF